MSYLRSFDSDTLPHLNSESQSARRIRALEEELAAFKRNTPRTGILKYSEFDGGNGSITRRAVAEVG